MFITVLIICMLLALLIAFGVNILGVAHRPVLAFRILDIFLAIACLIMLMVTVGGFWVASKGAV